MLHKSMYIARTARSAQDSCGSSPALEHGELMPQDEDLGARGAAGPGEPGKAAGYAERCQAGES